MLRCRNCTATLAFLQCGSHLDQKLRCSKRETALQHRKSCVAKKVALSCRSPAGFKPPRLGTHVPDLLIRVCLPLLAFVCVLGPTSESLRSAIVCVCVCSFALNVNTAEGQRHISKPRFSTPATCDFSHAIQGKWPF